MDTPTTKSFSASLRLPIGHASPPILEHFSTGVDGGNGASTTSGSGVNIGGVAGNEDSSCTIISGPVPGMYNVELAGRLDGCGVRKCTEQGEEWLCLLVRFPLLKGKRVLICFSIHFITSRHLLLVCPYPNLFRVHFPLDVLFPRFFWQKIYLSKIFLHFLTLLSFLFTYISFFIICYSKIL